MEGEWETAPKISNGTSLNDLDSPRFQGHDIIRQVTQKLYKIELYLQWPTNRKLYMIYQTAPFSMILNYPYPQFQGHAIIWCGISEMLCSLSATAELLVVNSNWNCQTYE